MSNRIHRWADRLRPTPAEPKVIYLDRLALIRHVRPAIDRAHTEWLIDELSKRYPRYTFHFANMTPSPGWEDTAIPGFDIPGMNLRVEYR